MPPEQLLRLMGVLDHSYQFARMFNDDKELRTGLWKVGMLFTTTSCNLLSWIHHLRLHETLAQPPEARVK